MLFAVALASAADCPRTFETTELSAVVRRAESALESADVDGFQSSLNEATLILPCLSQTISGSTAGRLHRLEGVRAFVGGDVDGAAGSFLAARRLDPDAGLPTDLFPEGHEIHDAFGRLTDDGPDRQPLPKKTELAFDGATGRDRPAGATIVQLTDADGMRTAYVPAGAPLPAYPVVPRTRNSLLIGSGIAVVGAGVLYGLALSANADFDKADRTATLQDLEAIQGRANGLVYGSIALTTVAIGGGVGAGMVGVR